MKITAKINSNHLKYMKKLCNEALVETADALLGNLKHSQTMPFATGALQNRTGNVDTSNLNKGIVTITSDTPYARRMYYHPEYRFYKGHNRNAGGMWFQPYIDGNKKDFASKAFAKILRDKL